MNISQLQVCLALCFARKLIFTLGEDPCKLHNYKDLNRGDRSEKYKDASDRCDGYDLVDEWHYWYVVSGNAGNALATNNAPAEGSCGTTDRLYLKGQHPLFGEGEVTRKLCIAKGNKACEQEQSIQVINCGAFYMYKLYNNGECSPSWGYCTNGVENVSCYDFNCPSGLICTLQNNGENRRCLDPNQVPGKTVVQTQHEITATPKTANPTSDTTTTQLTTNTTTTKPTSDTIKAQATTNTSTEKLTDKTTAKLKTDTTAVKPTSVTITVHLMTDNCTAKPKSHTITAQPTAKTSTAKLTAITTAKLRTDTSTAKPRSDTTTAQQTTDITTQVTRDSVSTPLQSSSSSPTNIRTSVIQQYHSAELSIPTEAKTVKRPAMSESLTSRAEIASETSSSLFLSPFSTPLLSKTINTPLSESSTSDIHLKSSSIATTTITMKKADVATRTSSTPKVEKNSPLTWLTEQAAITLKATSTPSTKTTTTAAGAIAETAGSGISKETVPLQPTFLISKSLTTELDAAASLLPTTKVGTSTELAVVSAMYTITLKALAIVTTPSLQSITGSLPVGESLVTNSLQLSSTTETTGQTLITATSTKSDLKQPEMTTSQSSPSVTTLKTGQSTGKTSSEYLSTLAQTEITETSTKPAFELPGIATTPSFSSTTMFGPRESTMAAWSKYSSAFELAELATMSTKSAIDPQAMIRTPSFSSIAKLGTKELTKATSSEYLSAVELAVSKKSTLEPPVIATTPVFSSITTLKTGESTRAASSKYLSAEKLAAMSTNSQEEELVTASNLPSIIARFKTAESVVKAIKSELLITTKTSALLTGKGAKTVTPLLQGSASAGVSITTLKAITITATTAAATTTPTSIAGQQDNPCIPNPCENYGNCSRTVDPEGFNCSCTSEYTGNTCGNKIVHGNWSAWTQWPNCNRPCNGGNKTRKRQCDNPKPAFGGRYCIGQATEMQFCNMDSCPADEVNFEVRLKAETWSDELANPESELYKRFKDEIESTVTGFYLEKGETITFKLLSLRQGSIIASFNITYPAIDSLQIVILQEQITAGTLGNFPAELLNITSSYVPNEAPFILELNSPTSTTIHLKWSEVTQLNSVPLLGYVIIFKENITRFQPDIQKSVPPSPQKTVLKDLKKFTHYTIRVYAFTRNGNGIPSKALTLRTEEDVPSEPPPNTVITVTSSRSIRVSWKPINAAYVHGILLGYEVRFAKDDWSTLTWISKRLGPEIHHILLDELAPNTWYWVVICARTSKGCGKEYFDLVQTWEDVPSMPPVDFKAYNLTSEAFINVSWSPVPSNHINGILLGYSLKYQRVQTSERQVSGVDEHTLTLRPTDLSVSLHVEAYSIYKIGVAAFTRKGMGPYTEYAYVESCRCPKVLYTNFWSTSPYLRVNKGDNRMEGIFSKIVTDMIFTACGLCPGHGSSTIIEITTNGKGDSSGKKSISEVLDDIDDIPQISFPIYGNKYITRYLGAYAYINLVDSPGVAFIAAKSLPGSAAKNMINAVVECIPMIILSACMAYISGFIIWVLDSRFNPDEFPPAFIEGVGEGFWWSFISMTTVGYGDRCPRSFPARVFGIIWTLIGLVIISILIGAIASSLTYVNVNKPVTLYGAKIGAIQNSVEYRLGILKNAKVNGEKEYHNVDEIRTALKDGEIDGALLDTYVAAEHKETLFDDRIYVKEILERPVGYGVVLSGAAVGVEQQCRDYINMHITEIFHIIQNMTKTLDAPAESALMEQSTGLFDNTSEMFRISLVSLLAVLGVAILGGLSYHFMIYVPRRKRVDEARITDQQLSYQKALNDEMKAFVNSFYMDMFKKISTIKKELQEVVNRKRRAKYKMRIGRSADSSKRDTESSIVVSNQTPRSWTSEKQYEKQKHVVQLVSNNENNKLEHSSQRVLLKSFSFLSGDSLKCQEPFCSQTLPNMVISEDDIEPGYSSC